MIFRSRLLLGGCLLAATLSAHTYDTGRPDAHAPIAVMGDHYHQAGEWMLSYRFMSMDMDGMRSGTDRLTPAEVFADNYTVTPVRMTMDMHMVGAMYAPDDAVTLMVMGNYRENAMDHVIFPMASPLIALNGGSDTFTTESSGWGDTSVTALVRLWENEATRLHLNLGISLPTGSIDEEAVVPGPGGRVPRILPAAMQLGSGTWDLKPAITVQHQFSSGSVGAQASAVWRLDENDRGYRHGHVLQLESWGSYVLAPWASLGVTLRYRHTGQLSGNQAGLARNPPFAPARRTVTTAFGENYGGERLEGGLGLNLQVPGTGHRLALEIRQPLWQAFDGPRLETDRITTLGWQWSF
ncbi:MAG: transporter [Opitutales bacterium]